MDSTDDIGSPLDIFATIHREMLTLIAHCTFHRSLLQDIVQRHADSTSDSLAVLERWRESSLAGIERMRFGDLNKRDKQLAAEVYREATRTAESFWNVLLAQAERDETAPAAVHAQGDPGRDTYDNRAEDRDKSPAERLRGA
jgi:hypothetical protein